MIPVAAGIDPTDQGNWVGSCKKCNARRGAEHLAKTRANRVAARTKAVKNPPDFFEHEATPTPTPIFDISEKGQEQAETAGTGSNVDDAAQSGMIPPRLETEWQGLRSYGGEVAAWAAKYLNVTLMPWQVHALTGQLEQIRICGDPNESQSTSPRPAHAACIFHDMSVPPFDPQPDGHQPCKHD